MMTMMMDFEQTQPEPAETPADAVAHESAERGEDWTAKYRELYDQHLRLAADFDNFRKRRTQEMDALRKYGAERTLTELLPFLDNLERAEASLNEASDAKTLYQSFRLIHNQLMESLGSVGVRKIATASLPFDPVFHEAVGQMETTEHPDHTVFAEQQSGYLLHDRVLRPARVIVAVSPAEPSQQEPVAAAPSGSGENPFRAAFNAEAPGD